MTGDPGGVSHRQMEYGTGVWGGGDDITTQSLYCRLTSHAPSVSPACPGQKTLSSSRIMHNRALNNIFKLFKDMKKRPGQLPKLSVDIASNLIH